MDLNDILEYCPKSPSGLIWKIDILSGKYYDIIRVHKGDVAGSNKNAKGYWHVVYNKISYKAHRVVWKIHNGEIPAGMHVDHIDRNKSNNCIENLRVVSSTVNKRNSGKYSNNKTGITGVRTIIMNGKLYFCATWATINFKRKAAYYNTEKYGYDKAFEMACERRTLEIESLINQGAEYTSSHGK